LNLPSINTKSSPSEIVSWKNSQQVKDVAQKLNQNIAGYEDLTWCTKILEKIWRDTGKVSKEKIAFTLSIIQCLVDPNVENIKAEDDDIQDRMKGIIVSINLLN
jgi:predicted enzyme related to lactoylglutathione lyase